MKKFRIYLSIPISGCESTLIERTKESKEDLIKQLNKKGIQDYEIVLPVDFNEEGTTLEDFLGTNVEHYEEKDYAWFMGKDIENLLRCDAIYLSRGWKNSKGCRAEKQIANIYELKKFYSKDTSWY